MSQFQKHRRKGGITISTLNIIRRMSPNYTKGRRKYNGQTEEILAITDHQTAGKFPGCLNWLCNPQAKASSHYLVTRQGEIYRLVEDKDTAWANGIVNKPNWSIYSQKGYNPNRYTVSIEHENYPEDGEPGLTEAQYQATLSLHLYLIKLYNIPVDREHIIGHNRIDSVNRPNCPGKYFPWDRLFKDLRERVIDLALEKWMREGGQEGAKYLAEKGLLINPEQWSTDERLESPFPSYLAWMMLSRLVKRMEGEE